MAALTLIATEAATRHWLQPQIVVDILWAMATPADRLEHLHSKSISNRIDLTLFHRTTNPTEAQAAAVRLCQRALEHSPSLQGWALYEPP